MKKWIWVVVMLAGAMPLFSQTKVLEGRVYDAFSSYPVHGANVYNMNTNAHTFTNADGEFLMKVSLRDSLLISSGKHRQLVVVVDQLTFNRGKKSYLLYIKPFMLPGVTIYALNPTYEGFKKDVASRPLSEFYKNLEDVHLTKEERRNATYTEEAPNILKNTKLGSPITLLYNSFSRKAKMHRLYEEMEASEEEVQQLMTKYNREMVAEITGLPADEVSDFMMFCHFSYYDLVRWSREDIVAKIRQKFTDYEYFRAISDDDW